MVVRVPMAIMLHDDQRIRSAITAARESSVNDNDERMTQEYLAAKVGISLSAMKRIESGLTAPTANLLVAIFRTCGFSVVAISDDAHSIPPGVKR